MPKAGKGGVRTHTAEKARLHLGCSILEAEHSRPRVGS